MHHLISRNYETGNRLSSVQLHNIFLCRWLHLFAPKKCCRRCAKQKTRTCSTPHPGTAWHETLTPLHKIYTRQCPDTWTFLCKPHSSIKWGDTILRWLVESSILSGHRWPAFIIPWSAPAAFCLVNIDCLYTEAVYKLWIYWNSTKAASPCWVRGKQH